jgi:hypothetical protein
MVVVDKLICGILLVINLPAVPGEGLRALRFRLASRGYPPPPPSRSPAGRGVCKKRLQNLGGKELRGQNLENMRLTPVLLSASPTASASTMMGQLGMDGKVGCHSGAVDNFAFGVGSRAYSPKTKRTNSLPGLSPTREIGPSVGRGGHKHHVSVFHFEEGEPVIREAHHVVSDFRAGLIKAQLLAAGSIE